MIFIDTHCHIHDIEFFSAEEAEAALMAAVEQGITGVLLIATSLEDSRRAIDFANTHPQQCFASIGIHPHEAANLTEPEISEQLIELEKLATHKKVVAVGECGFDFYYNDRKSALGLQEQLLRGQLDIAVKHRLPLSFHVREAFEDFWRVFEAYEGLSGVLHSFTDRPAHLERALGHGLKIGVNGIATFTAHSWQRELFKSLRLHDFVLETDSPFLTPVPRRGTINTPENVIYITKFLADLRGESSEKIAEATTVTAKKLFSLS